MLNSKFAIIDLGTNTFHLLIVEINEEGYTVLKRVRDAVRLGQGGIDKRIIAPDAEVRALNTLTLFHQLGKEYEVNDYFVYATSAVRNATNKDEFIRKVFDKTGLKINAIDGEREAELIFKGVRLDSGVLGSEPSLIVDIGGGSVEFIIANENEKLWMQSFEIGGQRLKNMFHTEDPIQKDQINKLYLYLDFELKAVREAIAKYQPTSLVGCSGTFDTLLEIEQHTTNLETDSFSRSYFNQVRKEIVSKSRADRLSIPGMIVMRVDLIVVSVCIVDCIFQITGIDKFKVCRNALKEGVVFEILEDGVAVE